MCIRDRLVAAQSRVSTILAELSAFDAYFRLQFQLWLLFDEAVQRDLELTEDQTAKVSDLYEASRPHGPGGGPPRKDTDKPGQEMRQMTPEQKSEKFSNMAG